MSGRTAGTRGRRGNQRAAQGRRAASMTFRIFGNTFLIGALVYFLCAAVFLTQLYRYFENQLFDELQAEAQMLVQGMETQAEEPPHDADAQAAAERQSAARPPHDADAQNADAQAAAELKPDGQNAARPPHVADAQTAAERQSAARPPHGADAQNTDAQTAAERQTAVLPQTAESFLQRIRTKNRITLIRADGTVCYDSAAGGGRLENHAGRSEFIDALNTGTGRAVRYSDTMLRKTLYSAVRMADGGVLRISCDQHSVGVLIFGMSQPLLFMLVIALILSGVMASLLAKKITEPLNKIDLDNPENCQVYEEMEPFVRRIAEENYEKAEREQLRRQFSANVSHELKTPLTSISGFAELMKSGGIDLNTMREFACDIYNESQRLIALVNDIIKLSRLDEQSVTMEKERIDLYETAAKICRALKPAAAEKRVTVSVTGRAGYINGVPQVIHEMIYNLCDNAVKYNKKGGSVTVSVMPDEDGSEVTLTVSDTGIGIPEKDRDRVFERFYCVDKSRSKSVGGTGLGLSIVKHGAKYHDAELFMESKEGEGSAFTLIFPGANILLR